ncbi:peptide ABC transporter substrate-binding protein [Microtetraspora sp. NBRC 16547]|uniref:ABC transporter substrate-binding protein n=1 Tax=Microtetraspora sp. NBRC 16547 TaxID=3030993 RepID=UPI0024A3FCEE|nr:peptide ABC transporter substrate-binding protein [Microtetraspora sp. NBRC 16547]GLX02542.1 peptide ABC transporter substrate-binding protein [Microtetraspora sp. NBRC 16547]
MGTGNSRHKLAALAACALSGSLLAGTALAAGPAASAASASAASQETTLRVKMSGSGVDTLNPFLAFFDGAYDVFAAIYPTLNSLDETGKPGPYLADSWTQSDDKLTWTFKIRDGLKWSDGTPLTAEDAAWTLNLITTDAVAGTANGSLVSNFESVTAPDATTLVIKTKEPQANVTYVSVPRSGIPIVPKHIWESQAEHLKDYKNDTFPVVGYGPWTLTDYKPEQYAKFDANKDFILGKPGFDHMVQQSFKSVDAAVAALRSGQLDYINGVNPTQFKALQADKSLLTIQEVGNGWTGLEINYNARTRTGKKIGTGHPALGDPVLRHAIALATDRQTLVNKVRDGLAVVGAGYLPPAWPQWVWKPAPGEETPFDLDQANKILDDAGYTKGGDGVRVDPKSGKPLELRLGIHSDDTDDAGISNYLKGWLETIGVKLKIQTLSMSALNSDLAKGDWDLLMDGWTTGPDPTFLLGIQTCAALPKDDGTAGNTDSFFCDKDYDELFKKQLTTFDLDERAKTVGEMQSILYKADVNQMHFNANHLDVVRTDTVTGVIIGQPDAQGMYPAQSYAFWGYLKATPATAKVTAAKEESGGSALWIGGAVLLVVLVGGGIALKRRSGADDRE